LSKKRSKLRQRGGDFVAWVLDTPPIRLPGAAAAIFTASTTGIPLAPTHHLRDNRVLHERVPLVAGITRMLFYFGLMEAPDVTEGLTLACREPERHRRVMVIPNDKIPGMTG
jgi:KUP system potassium uptake protein